MQPSVFQQVLGAAFFRLPDSLRQLHSSRGLVRYTGRATVERGRNPLARLCAWLAGLPPAGQDVATGRVRMRTRARDRRLFGKRG